MPDDVSVVGYDDLKILNYLPATSRLTSVRVPKFEVGRTAAEILHADIETANPSAIRKVYLKAELVPRETSAPPNPVHRAPVAV